MSKRLYTRPGEYYRVLFTRPGEVAANINGASRVLARASQAGEIYFQAVSESVTISDNDAVALFHSRKFAEVVINDATRQQVEDIAAGAIGSSLDEAKKEIKKEVDTTLEDGLAGVDDKITQKIDSELYETAERTVYSVPSRFTIRGSMQTSVNLVQYIRIPRFYLCLEEDDKLVGVSLLPGETSTRKRYMKIGKIAPTAESSSSNATTIACSTNAVTHVKNEPNRYDFDPLILEADIDIMLALTSAQNMSAMNSNPDGATLYYYSDPATLPPITMFSSGSSAWSIHTLVLAFHYQSRRISRFSATPINAYTNIVKTR